MTIFVKWFIINAIIITGLILAQTHRHDDGLCYFVRFYWFIML
jgi:hypothetical protein